MKAKQTIAICTHALAAGGAERQWVYLAVGLKRCGFDVLFFTFIQSAYPNRPYYDALKESEIDVIDVGMLPASLILQHQLDSVEMERIKQEKVLNKNRLIRIAIAFKAFGVRAVYSQLDEPNIYFSAAARIISVEKLLISFRNFPPNNFSYLKNDWMEGEYRKLVNDKRVKMTSNFIFSGEAYAEWLGFESKRVHVVQNAIDYSKLPSICARDALEIRSELGIPNEAKLILGVFRLSEEKRPFDFLKVCFKTLADDHNVFAILCGDGPLKDDIGSEIMRNRAIADRFVRLSHFKNIYALMAASDVLLHTAKFEGMPNVIMEAMTVGMPVVSTAVGAVPEMMRPYKLGRVADVGDCCTLVDLVKESIYFGKRNSAYTKHFPDLLEFGQQYADLLDLGKAST